MTAPPTTPPVVRFAPTPNGELHMGHALSALLNFEIAGRIGGRFLLRIEDIDTTRSRPGLIEGIARDLAWLGVAWEQPVLMQSRHMQDYGLAARRLEEMELLYPCFATRSEIQAAAVPGQVDPDGAPLYPGLHRGLDAAEVARRQAMGQPFAMRLKMAEALKAADEKLAGAPLTFTELDADGMSRTVAADAARWGDVVLRRKETPTSYHLSVVVDDARQGISHVVRGTDLRASTGVHRLLQTLLGLPAPVYHHHALVTDGSGRKLAKSSGDNSLREMRSRGVTAADIRRLCDIDATVERLAAGMIRPLRLFR